MPAFQGNSGRLARFGVFELDLAAGELRKNGAKLRLQEQPFQVLALLLERAGDVVTREELRQKLWPADTFVDFDHSLNTAVNKLRETLGDSASSPRYIETLARRGYRFIAPLENSGEKGQVGTTAPGCPAEGSSVAEDSTNLLHPELEVPIPRRGLTRGLFALVQAMYLIFYVVALFRLQAVLAVADSFLPGWGATVLVAAVMGTAGVGGGRSVLADAEDRAGRGFRGQRRAALRAVFGALSDSHGVRGTTGTAVDRRRSKTRFLMEPNSRIARNVV